MPYDDEPVNFEEVARLQNLDEQIDQRLHENTRARPDRQDALDPELLRDLRDFYQPHSQAFQQGLNRVWGRLEQRGITAAQSRQPRDGPHAQPGTPQERFRPMHTIFRTGQRWSARASTLVAAVLLVILVGGLTLGLILVRHNGNNTGGGPQTPTATSVATATPPSTPTATPAAGQGGLTSIHMIDAMTGWGLNGQEVFRTTDGGNHWQDVTPSSIKGQVHDPLSGSFLTAALAWLEASPGPTIVWRTTDGGQTWQSTEVQTALVGQITFIDPQNGWLVASHGVAAGSEDIEIFRTTDGGITWRQIENDSPVATPTPGALPFSGDKGGVSFLNASTGWAVGSEPTPNFVWLYVTHDGGFTWQHQTLPLPPGMTNAFFTPELPTFFDAHTGVLPLLVQGDHSYLDVYVTHDGGATWQGTTLVQGNAQIVNFADANHGWATDGTALISTSDGGQHWTLLPASSAFQGVTSLNFVSSTTGWAISEPPSGVLALLKTTDGGHTWAVVTPTL